MNFLFSQDNCESQTFHFKGFPNMLSCEMVTCALSGQAPAQIVFLTSLPLRWYTHLLKGKDLIHVIPSEPKQCQGEALSDSHRTNKPFPRCLCLIASLRRGLRQNVSYENNFDLYESEPVGGTHFHMNGLALRLVLTHRQKATRKWPTQGVNLRVISKSVRSRSI